MADSTVVSLGAVTTPADADLLYLVQGSSDFKMSLSQLKTYINNLANDAVSYAMLQNVSAESKILGRGEGAGSGDVQELSLGAGLSMSGTTLNNTVTSDYVLISSVSASGGPATVDFTGLSSTYFAYKIVCAGIRPGTNNALFYIRTSTNNGSSYDAGASDYKSAGLNVISADLVVRGTGHNGATAINTGFCIGNGSGGYYGSGEITFYRPSTSEHSRICWNLMGQWTTTTLSCNIGFGARIASGVTNAIRFLWSSGSFDAGEFKLYGLRA